MEKKIKIIIVDDHKIFLEGLKAVLKLHGKYQVIAEAYNGIDFLKLLPDFQPDIVIMDIGMPEMDGVTATELALQTFPDLKIIALTSFGDEAYYHKMVDVGVRGFVIKKSSSEEVEMAINAVMNGDNYFSQDILKQIIKTLNNSIKKIDTEKNEKQKFTPRELEVLKLICDGYSNQEIADNLNVSSTTISTHKTNIFVKAGVNKTVNLIMYAIKNKLIQI